LSRFSSNLIPPPPFVPGYQRRALVEIGLVPSPLLHPEPSSLLSVQPQAEASLAAKLPSLANQVPRPDISEYRHLRPAPWLLLPSTFFANSGHFLGACCLAGFHVASTPGPHGRRASCLNS
jgi:hypothetical protein